MTRAVNPASAMRRWYEGRPLFWKMVLPTAAVVVISGLGVLVIATRFTASQLRSQHDQRLERAAVLADTLLHDRAFGLLEAVRVLPNLEETAASVETVDRPALENRAASVLAVREGLDVVVFADASGHGLVEARRAGDGTIAIVEADDWSAEPVVADVLAGRVDAIGDKRVGFVRRHPPALVAVAPVKSGDEVVGAAIAGATVGRVADALAERAGGAVALYDTSGALLGSSSPFPPSLPDGAGGGSEPVRTAWEGSGSGSALYAPLALRGSEPAGRLAVGLRHRSVASEMWGTSVLLAAVVMGAAGALVAVLAFLTRGIRRRVDDLVRLNRALGRGDFTVRADVVAGDELSELARGMNRTAEQLAAVHEEMERQVAARADELRRLYEEKAVRLDDLNDILATIGHDFQNPLFSISAMAQLMGEQEVSGPDPEWPKEFGETIGEAVEDLRRRLDGLMKASRPNGRRAPRRRSLVDLGGLVEDLERTIRVLAERAGQSVELRIRPSLPECLIDENGVRDVVLNLVSNAVKYTPPGGRVTVEVRPDGRGVELRVADTGVGIPETALDHVFEPFYRVRGVKPLHGQPSTGLGLAISKRVVEAHGGTIELESEVGSGTTVTVRLPSAAKRTPRRRRAPAPAASATSPTPPS